jgi:hypothetical protein
MLDVVADYKAEYTKHAKDQSYVVHDVNYQSRRKTMTEVVRLDGAKFKPDDREKRREPKDKGPILEISPVPGPDNLPPAKRPGALVRFGGDMKPLGPVFIRDRRWLIERLTSEHYLRHEAKLMWDKQRQALFLIVLVRIRRPEDPDPDHREKRVASMDPGQRRFQTFIDMQTGTHGELLAKYRNGAPGAGETTVGLEMERRCERIDRLSSVLRKNKAISRVRKRLEFQREFGGMDDLTVRRKLWQRGQQQRRQKRRLLGRLYAHLRSFKLDMHYAAIRFLWEHWDTVLVSDVRMDLLCQHHRRPFGSAVARRLLGWCHGAFRERLISSAFGRESPWW